MPSDIRLRRFKGLQLFSGRDGELDELLIAHNIQFDEGGIAGARMGMRFITNTPAYEFRAKFVGRLTGATLPTSFLFAGDKGYYYINNYTAPFTDPHLAIAKQVAVSASQRTSNVVTLTVLAGHGFVTGDKIYTDVVTASFDGVFTVTSTTATTILYGQTGVNESGGAGFANMAPKNKVNIGVQYVDKFYFLDAKNWNGSVIASTPGQPVAPEGSMCVHAERIWLTDQTVAPLNNRLRFSEAGNAESWPAANFIDVEPTDDWITNLISYQGRLFIFKNSTMFVLDTPGPPTTWHLRKFAQVGANNSCVSEVDGILYWIGFRGVYSFTGKEIKRISNPIQSLWGFQQGYTGDPPASPFGGAVPPVGFRDQIIFVARFRLPDFSTGILAFLIYNTELEVWSEWSFPFVFGGIDIESIWALDRDIFGSYFAGIFWSWKDVDNHAMIMQMIPYGTSTGGSIWIDNTGSNIPAQNTLTDHLWSAVIQTKFTDFGDDYDQKRVLDWRIDYEGANVTVEQIDSENRRLVNTAVVTPSFGVINSRRFRGIGYCRRMSLKLTFSNIRDTGVKVMSMAARVRQRGTTITDQAQTFTKDGGL